MAWPANDTLTVDLTAENVDLKGILYAYVLEEVAKKIKQGETSGTVRCCNWELKAAEAYDEAAAVEDPLTTYAKHMSDHLGGPVARDQARKYFACGYDPQTAAYELQRDEAREAFDEGGE